MSGKNTLTGRCLCGAVEFELKLPSKWCAHCHCTMCRRAHGAGYVTSEGRRGFCNECGSTMLFESSRWAGETHVALACIDGEIDRKPRANAFFDTHVGWMPIDDGLEEGPG